MIDYRIRVSIEELGWLHFCNHHKILEKLHKDRIKQFVFGRTFYETLDMNKNRVQLFQELCPDNCIRVVV